MPVITSKQRAGGVAEKPADAPKRRSRKKERTRREIYEAAMSLFAEQDYASVTIDAICAKAEIAKATFFLHFHQKSDLLLEFNQKLAARLADELARNDASARADLEFLVEFLIAEWQINAAVVREMVREFNAQPDVIIKAEHANRTMNQLVTAIIEKGQARGEFRSDLDAALIAGALIASWSAIVLYWTKSDGTVDAGKMNTQILSLVLHGLEKR